MGDRIRSVAVRPIRLTPTEAELAVKVEVNAPAADAEVHGRLMGPTCKYSSTIEVAYPIRRVPEASGPTSRIGRVIIPEPAWWDLQSPFLYHGPVDLWEGGQAVAKTQVRCGLHHATAVGGRLMWNGRPLELRVASKPVATIGDLAALREVGWNLVLVDADVLPGLLDTADEIGILLAGYAADAAARASPESPLHHPSLLGFIGSTESGGPLYLTGGRGLLELVPETDA
ncbi:MAG TPA: hypothetical protein VH120_04125 [Gemmataceae bacterium]|nr:hypothetical protein [Gemmataceae bacterium]